MTPNKRSNSYSIGWICFTRDLGAQVHNSGSRLQVGWAAGRCRFDAPLQSS
jgi:hypothetical protein